MNLKMNDKLLHFFAGSYVALLAMEWVQWAFALAIVATVALVKEIYDKVTKSGTPEVLDFFATLIGGAVTIGLIILK